MPFVPWAAHEDLTLWRVLQRTSIEEEVIRMFREETRGHHRTNIGIRRRALVLHDLGSRPAGGMSFEERIAARAGVMGSAVAQLKHEIAMAKAEAATAPLFRPSEAEVDRFLEK